MIFALSLPALLGAGGAAIDFARYSEARTELQEIADAAALAGAREYLRAKNVGALAKTRAEDAADALILTSGSVAGASGRAVADDREAAVTVSAAYSYRPTLFVALFKTPILIEVTSTAAVSGGANICVIALAASGGDVIKIDDSSTLMGDDCAVYSNSTDPKGLLVKGGARLESAFTCSSGGYGDSDNHFSPPPVTDCPARADPLSDRIEPAVGGCDHMDRIVKDYVGRLSPGVYCEGLVIDGSSDVTLDPGIYVIKDGAFQVKSTSRLAGDGVGFFFVGDDAGVKFEDKASISLAAPESGEMAGVLFWQSVGVKGADKFEIYSNDVDRLVGTIYLPDADFVAAATADVAEDSAYTAIIAKRIHLGKNTRLVLNTDYALTPVPVPAGIANAGGTVFLRE